MVGTKKKKNIKDDRNLDAMKNFYQLFSLIMRQSRSKILTGND